MVNCTFPLTESLSVSLRVFSLGCGFIIYVSLCDGLQVWFVNLFSLFLYIAEFLTHINTISPLTICFPYFLCLPQLQTEEQKSGGQKQESLHPDTYAMAASVRATDAPLSRHGTQPAICLINLG